MSHVIDQTLEAGVVLRESVRMLRATFQNFVKKNEEEELIAGVDSVML